MNVFDILKNSAREHPEQLAIVDKQGELTYAELLRLTNDVRQQLCDIEPGSCIGLQAENGRGFIAALFAIAAAEAIVVPLGPDLTHSEIGTILAKLPLRYILRRAENSPQDTISTPVEIGGAQFSLEHQTQPQIQLPEYVEHPAFIRPTSGTTGSSKGVLLSHETALQRIVTAQKSLQLSPADRIIWVLPMAYHFIVSVLLYVRAGAQIIICSDSRPKSILEAAFKYNATVLYGAPTQYTQLVREPPSDNLKSLRWAICTSDRVSMEVVEKFKNHYQIPLRSVYGIIEVGLPIGNLRTPPAKEGSIGQVLSGFETTVLDDSLNACPPGEIGELAIRGPGLFDAYLTPPSSRASQLKDGWFMPGDLVRQDADGNFYFVGRKKSMIVVEGNKVFPEEIEQVLNQHPEVTASRVFGKLFPEGKPCISAEVVLRNHTTVSARDIVEFCEARLSDRKIPQEVRLVNYIETTATGKIYRKNEL